MITVTEPTRPFSNGTEFDMWNARNCERCKKSIFRFKDHADRKFECDIEEAISTACMGDGTIPLAIFNRVGWSDERRIFFGDCPERNQPPRLPEGACCFPGHLSQGYMHSRTCSAPKPPSTLT